MAICGIIAEFNPLHKGHEYILKSAKNENNTVVCVLSGNFVQRGDTAIIPKQKRAESALKCGADLVAELPVPWSMSTAQNFALGAVSQLMALGCDEIVFGSECGDINALISAVEILEHPDFPKTLKEELSLGITFAAARENAAKKLGLNSNILSCPNDTLGIEYICAARALGFKGTFRTIKRIGAAHDSLIENPHAISASLIREKLKNGDIGFAERFMPLSLRGFLNSDMLSNISRIDNAILSVLRMKSPQDFSALPDVSEGLNNKLYFSIRVATSFEELCNMVKTKRYSLARIRRLVISAFLGLDNTFFKTRPPYARILGFNEIGQTHLSKITDTDIPIITKVSQIRGLDEYSQKLFEIECRATDIYSLSLAKPQECGMEYKTKLIKI